jgi:hypothetical protein
MKPDHKIHGGHSHIHGEGCGHTAVRVGGEVGYLHNGHLHTAHGDHFDEASVPVSAENPAACAPSACGHEHGPGCGHEAVPHGDHVDYLVDGRLHFPHGGHCDDHGAVEIVPND